MAYVQGAGDGRGRGVDRVHPGPVGTPVEPVGLLLLPHGRPACLDAVEGGPLGNGASRDGPVGGGLLPAVRVVLVPAFFCHHR